MANYCRMRRVSAEYREKAKAEGLPIFIFQLNNSYVKGHGGAVEVEGVISDPSKLAVAEFAKQVFMYSRDPLTFIDALKEELLAHKAFKELGSPSPNDSKDLDPSH